MLNRLLFFFARKIRRVFVVLKAKDSKLQGDQYMGYVELFNEDANDYIGKKIEEGKPFMVAKFGTIELGALEAYKAISHKKCSIRNFVDFATLKTNHIACERYDMKSLCRNAGFFPNDPNLLPAFYEVYLDAIKQVDVLGSYIRTEFIFSDELLNSTKVNLDGYYAPFFYKNPWTKFLKGKKVLVIHPFADDIQSQYEKKNLLWRDNSVLPEFTLITYKAVQSMLGTQTEFSTWFDALNKMKSDIKKMDFDVALIGCGAYGMPLASFCKSLGKQAVHLAGWTQILFGIKGTRWDNNPSVSKFYNEFWIRPSLTNTPNNAKQVENGCYW